MLAEQDLATRQQINAMSTMAEYEVSLATDDDTTTAILAEPSAPQLAILDWLLLESSGMRRVREAQATCPPEHPYVIVLNACNAEDNLIEACAAASDDFLINIFDGSQRVVRTQIGARAIRTRDSEASRFVEPEDITQRQWRALAGDQSSNLIAENQIRKEGRRLAFNNNSWRVCPGVIDPCKQGAPARRAMAFSLLSEASIGRCNGHARKRKRELA